MPIEMIMTPEEQIELLFIEIREYIATKEALGIVGIDIEDIAKHLYTVGYRRSAKAYENETSQSERRCVK